MFMKPGFASVFYCLGIAFAPLAFGRTPSTLPSAATQPSGDLIPKYYNLVKNEFMMDSNDQIVLTTRAVQEAIRQARLKVAKEKADVDHRITSLNEEKRSNTENNLAELNKATALRQEAAEHDRKSVKWRIKRGPRGGITRWSSPNYKEQALATECRRQAEEHEAEVEKYRREIGRLDVELAFLRGRSAWLAHMALPKTGRDMPVKEFWEDLTTDQREQLERVGISRDEFKRLLTRTGQTEASFIAAARELRKGVNSDDELVHSLRDYFQERLASQARKSGMVRG
ncbi:MAG: hypothetical protein KA354_24020 [Phycisphaerae bacterium]|nr:hypothetical protein [Phycisphaerae bacterium]